MVTAWAIFRYQVDNLRGYVEKIIFRNPQNGYTVLSIEEDGVSTVCVGELHDISAGEFMEFTGEYVFHPRFGQQFKVESARTIIPEDLASVERYLASGAIKGIGAVTARRIIEKFGDDTMKILDEEPERLAEIKGISRSKAQEIAATQAEKKDIRNVCIFLGEYGVSNAMAVRLYGMYDQEIYSIVRDNPYQLADEVSGIGFRKADEIARKSGVDPGSDRRVKACIIYTLQRSLEQGHVYLPEDLLKQKVLETLRPQTVDDICEVEGQDIARCVIDLALDNRIIIKDGTPPQVYYSSSYYTELSIASMLRDLDLHTDINEDRVDSRIREVEKESDIILDDMQRQALKIAAGSGILIITGGPGTGKTTIINSLIRYFEKDSEERILLAAPTGRAARRMSEAAGREAKTIHRMLELSAELEDTSAGARFNKNEDSPLDADVVVVDEVSMVDIFLMNALLRAIKPGTRLILVGDVDQLPSVGPGNILRDLIESGRFNTVRLKKIFRQAEESEIIVNAHKINRGEHIELKAAGKDFIFIKRTDPGSVLGAVLTLVKDKLPSYVNADIRDIQVLSPMKNGMLGVTYLNKFLQNWINPASPEKKEHPVRDMIFREGDKVMHIKNNYDLEWEMRTPYGLVTERGTGVFNGDIGIIGRINEHTQLMEIEFDDGKHVIYTFDQAEELMLAYAATVHKSQGSEYPAVVLPLLAGSDFLMNRNILYTAVTRARKCVVIVGIEEAVNRMIDNIREQQRYSGLRERLMEVIP